MELVSPERPSLELVSPERPSLELVAERPALRTYSRHPQTAHYTGATHSHHCCTECRR